VVAHQLPTATETKETLMSWSERTNMRQVRQMAAQIRTEHTAVREMVESLGHPKVCTQWIPYLLRKKHTLQHKNVFSQQLEHCAKW
jgi:hypothetical protein